jgi:flagellar basal-body rod protein FlgC
MDFMNSLTISAAGMSAQRTRLEVATTNLANAEVTRGPDGQPFRRRDPVLAAVDFQTQLDANTAPGTSAVTVLEVVEDTDAPRRVYLPSHPDADAEGFIRLPNVDAVHETVNMVGAQNSFEANATAFETAKAMTQRALDIMR